MSCAKIEERRGRTLKKEFTCWDCNKCFFNLVFLDEPLKINILKADGFCSPFSLLGCNVWYVYIWR